MLRSPKRKISKTNNNNKKLKIISLKVSLKIYLSGESNQFPIVPLPF